MSKKYRIVHREREASYKTLAEEMLNFARKPIRWFKGQKDLTEEVWALKNVNFSIEPGEILGVIGPNGAGKSTLLKILSRITPPTSGKAVIKGRVSSLLEVGVGFHPELTGRENVYLNGAILGMTRKEIKKKFDEIVDFAGIEKFLDTPVKRFSSGMYVRLAFSVAAHLEPEILLVDEVLAVGDAAFQKKSLGKMEDVSRGGRTVLFVSHNMGTIQQLTKRCLLLTGGKLVLDGKTADVVEEYMKSSLSLSTSKGFDGKTEMEGLFVESIKMDEKFLENGFNKPLKFDLKFKTDHDIKDLLITLEIVNSVGAKIMTAKAVIPEINRGESNVSMVLENHYLSPGSYSMDTTMVLIGNCIFSRRGIISFEIPETGIEDWFITRSKGVLGNYPPVRYIVSKIK